MGTPLDSQAGPARRIIVEPGAPSCHSGGMECPLSIRPLLTVPDGLGELVPRMPGDPARREQVLTLPLGSGLAADCLRAGLLLRFNFLEEAHKLAQGIPTAEGSYWHAIMHRREPDYENAKYWYRRVGEHPALDALPQGDPFAFVDLCAAAEQEPSLYARAVAIQRAEWEQLFACCLRSLPVID